MNGPIIALAIAAAMLNPQVDQANIGATICQPGWAKAVRPSTAITRDYERRHLPLLADSRDWIVDHRIPLALGGAPDEPNLQLQTVADAKFKDAAERRLHRAVCRGDLTLKQAQKLIGAWGR